LANDQLQKKIDVNGALGTEVSGLFAAASAGDLTAQRRLRDCCIDVVSRGDEQIPNHDLLAAYAVFSARMAAARGDYSDLKLLAATLLGVGGFFGEQHRDGVARAFAAEALSLFERMGEQGDMEASGDADRIVALHPDLIPSAKFLMAKEGSK
jgi:hypothetical protein